MEFRHKAPAAIAVPLLVTYVVAYLASAHVVDIRVEDKTAGFDHPRDYSRPQVTFLIHADQGVFKVGWEPLFMEFAAAERYHALRKGGSYRVLVAGWRIPATNWYPSIVRIVE